MRNRLGLPHIAGSINNDPLSATTSGSAPTVSVLEQLLSFVVNNGGVHCQPLSSSSGGMINSNSGLTAEGIARSSNTLTSGGIAVGGGGVGGGAEVLVSSLGVGGVGNQKYSPALTVGTHSAENSPYSTAMPSAETSRVGGIGACQRGWNERQHID